MNNKIKNFALATSISLAATSMALATASSHYSDNGPASPTKQHRFPRGSVKQETPAPAPVTQAKPVKTSRPGFLPTSVKAGECYAQVIVPAQYRTVTERVLVKEASQRIEIIPAQFENVQERVMVRAPSEELEIIPATYKTVKEKILVTPASERIIEIPAQYGTREERILVSPERTVWKEGKNPLNELQHSTGEIVCLVTEPAVYKTVTKEVVVKKAGTRVEKIPAVYDYVEKVIVDKPAATRVKKIPAEYKMITVKKIVRPETKKVVTIPPEYKTVTRQVKSEQSKTEWRRVLCETNVTTDVIQSLQSALKTKGFYKGPIDGQFSQPTKMALENYQAKNSLPRGSLNFATLDALDL